MAFGCNSRLSRERNLPCRCQLSIWGLSVLRWVSRSSSYSSSEKPDVYFSQRAVSFFRLDAIECKSFHKIPKMNPEQTKNPFRKAPERVFTTSCNSSTFTQTLSSDDLVLVAYDLYEVHTIGEIADVVLNILLNIFNDLELATNEVENV